LKNLLFLFFLLVIGSSLMAQTATDTVPKKKEIQNADDPANFLTRVELFNEFQQFDTNVNVNFTTLRTIVKIGKRFTTRIDVPYVSNSFPSNANNQKTALGDISFRLLGYQIIENPKSAITASIEFSLNTAKSPFLGTGKNLISPVVSYSTLFPKQKMVFSIVFQQTNSISGDEDRKDISFSKVQFIAIKKWSVKAWTVIAPEWFLDYREKASLSMNLRSRMTVAPASRINVWISPSIGVFGDFAGHYNWSADVGIRYYLFKEMKFKN
jgi:hypothetical protein